MVTYYFETNNTYKTTCIQACAADDYLYFFLGIFIVLVKMFSPVHAT